MSNPDRSEYIRFKCRYCRQPLEAEYDMSNQEIACPGCGKNVTIPPRVSSVNPFQRPLRRLFGRISDIQWQVPFFPQLIQVAVLGFVVLIIAALYLTIGIVSQIESIFMSLMLDSRHDIKSGSLVEKSAYAVAAGIFLLCWLPFFLVLLPFTLLGWIWNHLGYLGLALLTLVLALVAVACLKPDWLSRYIDMQKHSRTGGAYSVPATPSADAPR